MGVVFLDSTPDSGCPGLHPDARVPKKVRFCDKNLSDILFCNKESFLWKVIFIDKSYRNTLLQAMDELLSRIFLDKKIILSAVCKYLWELIKFLNALDFKFGKPVL